MLVEYGSETRRINAIVNAGARTRMNNIRFLEKEIQKWKQSPIRKAMILADRYYQGDHDILHTPRAVINEKGELEPVKNLPDNRIVDNQYQKAVDQKKNYLLSKPFTITTKDDRYTEALKYALDKKFLRSLKRVAGDSINGGIGYLYPYYNNQGQLLFKRFKNHEIIPFWTDEDHTELDCFGRLYQLAGYEGEVEKTYEFFELYSRDGVDRYQLDGSQLIPDALNPSGAHYLVEQVGPDGEIDTRCLDEILEKADRLDDFWRVINQSLASVSANPPDITQEHEMLFIPGEVLRLKNKTLLEVIFADKEMAVCLKVKKCSGIGWTRTGKCFIISNRRSDYREPMDFEQIPSVSITGKYHCEPLTPKLVFPTA